jgi:nitrogen fixation-related uncharacterized protein
VSNSGCYNGCYELFIQVGWMTQLLLVLSLVGGALGALLYLLAIKQGHLDDVEETKYSIFLDDDENDY